MTYDCVNQALILAFRVFIRRIGCWASGRIQPVEVLFDFVKGHAQRQRGPNRFGTFEECAGVFQHQLGDLVCHTTLIVHGTAQESTGGRTTAAGRQNPRPTDLILAGLGDQARFA